MIKYSVVFLLCLLLIGPQYALCQGFSQDDRGRLIRLETKVEEGQKSLHRQIDSLNPPHKDRQTTYEPCSYGVSGSCSAVWAF
ncbi:MAG: hypothetical protein U5R49_07510 [Deltaproteobacteria bacterium]|nr:hypothetical protein [Deltaproteobacteria bacterium]